MTHNEQVPTIIDDYDYDLPDERIAKYPLEQRDSSKLLLWRSGEISENKFAALPLFLPENSLLIYNNTRVIQARIIFRKNTGARIEVFCLEPMAPADYALSLAAAGHCEWKCMVGNLKKWKHGSLSQDIQLNGKTITFTAELLETHANTHRVRFGWNDFTVSFSEILMQIGELPIPPYLHRDTEANDKKTYQTVYSRIEGSVAAPTAGLHFTQEVFAELRKKNIGTEELTLHVGAGTFQPVKSATVEQHKMHTETFAVERETIQRIIQNPGPLIAVGTTSVRTLESLYYIGKQLIENDADDINPLFSVDQWEPYDTDNDEISTIQALRAIDSYLEKTRQAALHGETQILIKPGFRFRLIDGMITNFHQPRSTLLLLVSAFVNGDWKRIYDYALSHNFRFLSYGDSSLLLKE